MKYKVVIFDLDNTLIDFDQMEIGSFNETLQAQKISSSFNLFKTYQEINKELWQGLEQKKYKKEEILTLRFEKLFQSHKIKASAEKTSQMYLDNMVNHLTMIEGAYDILKALKGKVTLVCLTNGVLEAQRSKLEKSDLNSYFDTVIISDEVGHHKPEVEIFQHMMDKIGNFDKSEMIMIGDSLSSDIQGAVNFKIKSVWFNHLNKAYDGPKIFDYEIKKLKSLENILF